VSLLGLGLSLRQSAFMSRKWLLDWATQTRLHRLIVKACDSVKENMDAHGNEDGLTAALGQDYSISASRRFRMRACASDTGGSMRRRKSLALAQMRSCSAVWTRRRGWWRRLPCFRPKSCLLRFLLGTKDLVERGLSSSAGKCCEWAR
jgi:hypothetical protein